MKNKILKAVMNRYGSLPTLKLCMWEDEDVVVMNLLDDLDYKYSEDEILNAIKNLLLYRL